MYKILIVEDNRVNRAILKKQLGEKYELLEAENGEEALAEFSQHPDISLILLDLVMPLMDGYAFLQRRTQLPALAAIPVAVLTEYDTAEAKKRVLSLGANDFLKKPYDPTTLLLRTETIIKLWETLSQNARIETQYSLLDTLYRTVPCAIYQYTRSEQPFLLMANYTAWNGAGYQSEEACLAANRENPLLLVHPDDRFAAQKRLNKILRDGETCAYEQRMLRADGSVYWIKGALRTAFALDGQPILQSFSLDITEIKQAEALLLAQQRELANSYAKLQIAIDQSGVEIWEYNIAARTFETRRHDQQKYGLPKGPVTLDFLTSEKSPFHPDDRSVLRDSMARLERGISPVDFVVRVRIFENYRTCRINYAAIFDAKTGAPISAMGITHDITDQLLLTERAQQDALTKLLNRQAFEDAVNLTVASDFMGLIAFFYIDLDNFKQINDTWGHSYGDEVLRFSGVRIKSLFRGNDYVGRLGGDEFAVLMTGLSSPENATDKAAHIIRALSRWREKKPGQQELSCSIGIAFAPQHGTTFEALSRSADRALYQAKQSGKARYYDLPLLQNPNEFEKK